MKSQSLGPGKLICEEKIMDYGIKRADRRLPSSSPRVCITIVHPWICIKKGSGHKWWGDAYILVFIKGEQISKQHLLTLNTNLEASPHHWCPKPLQFSIVLNRVFIRIKSFKAQLLSFVDVSDGNIKQRGLFSNTPECDTPFQGAGVAGSTVM